MIKSIGKYQVVEELGASAAGATYRVRDNFRNREFALKVLRTVPGLTTAAKEQFCAHLASCAELVHRHLVKVQDLGEVEEGLFVVSEWRTGVDLHHLMGENANLPLGQKLALVAQVAEGLAFAHSREIAHGNLKPSNVFVDSARDITILDFGIAKWVAALLEAGSRPEGLAVNYLAPEQVLGKPFDGRSDIFALGLMLYEFVAGKYPFSAAPSLIPREIVHSEVEPLRKLDPQIPEELDQLVQRALRKDPGERMQTAEEFAAGLYLAAQELRRRASAAPPVQPAREEPVVAQTPAPSSEPAFVQPAVVNEVPIAPTAFAPVAAPQTAPPQKVRERPQDEAVPEQPWTSRSYAANSPPTNAPALPQQLSAFQQQMPEPPAAPAASPTEPAHEPSAPPVQVTEQSTEVPAQPPTAAPPKPAKAVRRPQVNPPAAPHGKMSKRALTVVAGLILALVIVGSLVSRQGLRGSQNKNPATAPVAQPAAVAIPAEAPPAVAKEPEAPKPGESGPNDVGNPEFSAKQTLNGPVRTLWESGRYAEALALVNQVLADNPNNAAARAWKKKVRDAQEAEAALK